MAVFLPLLLIMACSSSAPPPRADARPIAPPPAPTAPQPPSVQHTVGEGQTLWDIARAYDVSVESIMEANDLSPRDVRRLTKGRVLRIVGASGPVAVETAEDRARASDPANLPPIEDGAYHVIEEGETLWDLARLYDKSLDEIVDRNELSDEDVVALRAGRVIVIPGIRAAQVRHVPQEERSAPVADTPNAPQRPTGVGHTMAPGETVWDLARIYGVGVAQIMAANALDPTEVTALREGRRLFVPGVSRDAQGRVIRRESATATASNARARRLGLGTHAAANSLLRGELRPTWIRAAGGDRLPGTLRWPIANGNFVRGYGSGEGGYHLAVDIRGDIGWNVRATAPGIVGYSGDEVPGYGNLIIVVHPGGWVTMYAHNSVNFVVAGQQVQRGTIISEVGSTGISRGPHVHFEFIFRGNNCDPGPLFRPGVRYRDGRIAAIRQITWTDPEERPEAIACNPRRRHPRSQWVIHEDPNADQEH